MVSILQRRRSARLFIASREIVVMPLTVRPIVGDSEEDTKLLREMATEAQEYISEFAWCPPIASVSLGFGIGGVVAIFLVLLKEKIEQTDERLWVVVGDLPSAYLVVEPQDSAHEALQRYCLLMDDWANEVLAPGTIGKVFPVEAQRTSANAGLLRSRLKFIR